MLRKFAAVILIDQITKAFFAHRDFFPPEADPPLAGFLRFHPVMNYGLSFGLNQTDGRLAAILVGVILAGFIIYFYKQQKTDNALLVVISAATSNLIDRAYFGGVRDFIDIGAFTFNLADMFIAAALFFMLFARRSRSYSDPVGG